MLAIFYIYSNNYSIEAVRPNFIHLPSAIYSHLEHISVRGYFPTPLKLEQTRNGVPRHLRGAGGPSPPQGKRKRKKERRKEKREKKREKKRKKEKKERREL